MADLLQLPAWTVAGAPVAATDVVVRWMNFGQPMREVLTPAPYVLTVSTDSVLECLQESYSALVSDVKADMAALLPGEEQDDETWLRLAQAGYPALGELLSGDFPLFADVAHDYLWDTLLAAYAGAGSDAFRYVLNTISRLEHGEGTTIQVHGECYVDRPLSAISGAYRRA